jgi:hypothetical protein
MMSRLVQRRSGTVMTLIPVLADGALTMSLTVVNMINVGVMSFGNAKSRPLSAPRVTSR